MPFGKTCLCIDLMSLGRPQELWDINNICECNIMKYYYKAVTTGTDVRNVIKQSIGVITSSQPMNKRGGTRHEISLEFSDRKLCLLSIQEII
jgi:hypothetical protein